MRIFKPWLLTNSRLEDQITCLNLVYAGKTLHVSSKWYQKCVEHGFLDDCCFNLVVEKYMFNPQIPTEL